MTIRDMYKNLRTRGKSRWFLISVLLLHVTIRCGFTTSKCDGGPYLWSEFWPPWKWHWFHPFWRPVLLKRLRSSLGLDKVRERREVRHDWESVHKIGSRYVTRVLLQKVNIYPGRCQRCGLLIDALPTGRLIFSSDGGATWTDEVDELDKPCEARHDAVE